MNIRESQNPPLEVWAGIECTVNRVHDQYHDQLSANGHAVRVEDLCRFAELGVKALRYPLLWERTAPVDFDNIDWSWADERLNCLRRLDIRPILGLVHHGSGPAHTSLIDPSFAEGLACYAGKVAARFPWLQDWTPVNEPLTTARFSGLYGHWYPHGRDERTFARAVITQCRAVALSMQAIRRVNSDARLIQTDDLGKVYSTPHMQYQADFENERRWLSWDLLSGLVDRYHPLWKHLLWAGIGEPELHWFLDNPCPPDLLGINHYLTSERYLDEHIERYPSHSYGDNGRDRYADVEAVRTLATGLPGIKGILGEAWARYKRPLAVTEVHLGCTREEQMRWLLEVWHQAKELRGEGMDIRAVTAWALLGSYDWDSLLTRSAGHYEPGVFDLRAPAPRPTALAEMLQQMTEDQEPDHPVLATPGWWRRSKRLLYSGGETSPSISASVGASASLRTSPVPVRPVLITGAEGMLGDAFARLCDHRGLSHHALSGQQMDITDPASVAAALDKYQPWAVINAAGFVHIEEAEQEKERCFRENTAGPALLAAACARRGLQLLTFSSDLVFNGRQAHPYVESDRPMPRNTYGRSKAKAEQLVHEILPEALIIRTGAFFGPWDEHNFVTAALTALAAGRRFAAAGDALVSPTYVPDLVHACLDLLIDGERGLWHLANTGALSWAEFALQAAEWAGFDCDLIDTVSTRSLHLCAPRTLYNVLGSERGQLLPSLETALECYFNDCGVFGADFRAGEHKSRTPLHRCQPSRLLQHEGEPHVVVRPRLHERAGQHR